MLDYVKCLLFIVAILINRCSKTMLYLTLIIGADLFMPIPDNAGRAVWCVDCVIVDALAGFLVLMFDAVVALDLCILCYILVPIHLVYMQLGFARFPAYAEIVPIIECTMLMICIIGGITAAYPTHRVTAAIKKHLWWMFLGFNLKQKQE